MMDYENTNYGNRGLYGLRIDRSDPVLYPLGKFGGRNGIDWAGMDGLGCELRLSIYTRFSHKFS